MNFASDNTAPAHPTVMEAMHKANEGYASSYGTDHAMEEVTERIRDLFEAPEAQVHLVATGTAANALILSCMAKPFDAIYSTPMAHIHVDECNGPEFYSSGAKIVVIGQSDLLETEALVQEADVLSTRGLHGPQHGAISITQVTERGQAYDNSHIQSIAAIAGERGMKLHMDGARFANAAVRKGAGTLAEMTWQSGVSALSFGGTKNGLLGVEAAVFFDPELAREFELRRKRGGHLFSKHRYLSAQMQAYLNDDLWLRLARHANEKAATLAAELQKKNQIEILHSVDANMIFTLMPRALHQAAHARGANYFVIDAEVSHGDPDERLIGRMVTNWQTTDEEISALLSTLQ